MQKNYTVADLDALAATMVQEQDTVILAILDVLEARGAFELDPGLRDAVIEAAHVAVGFHFESTLREEQRAAVKLAEEFIDGLGAARAHQGSQRRGVP